MPGLPVTATEGRPSPRVSIVTPSFNQGRYLEETMRSVLAQDYPNLEYIVIDGGSTDGSVAIIRKYEKRLAYWVSEPDRGQADAINKGFACAGGDLLGWLNSDDCLYPGAVRRLVEAFAARPETEFIYGDVTRGAELQQPANERRGQPIALRDMLRTLRMPIPQQAAMWRRSVIEKVGGLNPRWHVVLDREFFLRVALKCRMDYLPGVVGFFRVHPDCKSVAQNWRWARELPPMRNDQNLY